MTGKNSQPQNLFISLSAALFVIVLAASAWIDSTIRVLHVFEAIPYLLAAWLCQRKPKVGYALAFASGAFWIWSAGILTTFIRNGFERVITLVQLGTVDRPDILLAVPGLIGTLGLVIFSLVGYGRLINKSWKDLLLFVAMFMLVFLFFLMIFAAFTPQYLGMFTWMIGTTAIILNDTVGVLSANAAVQIEIWITPASLLRQIRIL